MYERRNPFLLRAAENIDTEDTFIRLYNPDFLDIFNASGNIWQRPLFIRGAPGDGKTSLLHMFTPATLAYLSTAGNGRSNQETSKAMKKLGALSDEGPMVIGAYLTCARNYHILDDLDIDIVRKKRLFIALFNSRITLSLLSAVCEAENLIYPDDLRRIKFKSREAISIFRDFPSEFSGAELYNWAGEIERNVCEALDSFVPLTDFSLPSHESLDTLNLWKSDNIIVDGRKINKKILIMIDDVQILSKSQRSLLYDEVINKRPNVGMWFSERLEALDTSELLSLGIKYGRDYGSVIDIGQYYRDRNYERFALNTTERRVNSSIYADQIYLRNALIEDLNQVNQNYNFKDISTELRNRFLTIPENYWKFFEKEAQEEVGEFDKLIIMRAVQIIAAREARKAQRPLFDIELPDQMIVKGLDNATKAAAEYFLCKEFDLPYFYGFSRLSALSSSNVEQLLWLSGELFEEIISLRLLNKSLALSPERQEEILKRTIRKQWDEINRSLGTDVKNLLQAIGTFCHSATNQPNAPYPPGVTGIAISMEDRGRLGNPEYMKNNPHLKKLARTITRAVAHNHLQMRIDSKAKGQTWFRLELNRMWCVQFDLPVGYGGWREQKLTDLVGWVDTGRPLRPSMKGK